MQLMNGFTILILTGFLHLVIGAAGLLIRSQDDTRPIVRLWVVAQLIGGVSQLLRLMVNDWPAFWSATLPNAAAALAHGLALLAVARLFKLPTRVVLVTTLLFVAIHLVGRNLGLSESTRLAAMTFLFVVQFCLYVHVYGLANRQHPTPLMNALQFANLLVVMTLLARTVEAAGAGPHYDFQHAGIGQALALIGIFVAVVSNGLGFLLILIERGTVELTRLSTLDPLTETLNRRSFLVASRQQLSLAIRNLHPVSVLICDIDHFKRINDQYGHPAGDQVIVALVASMRRTMRAGDSIARWGGEEFVLLMPHTPLTGAVLCAQRLNQAFANQGIPHGGKTLWATVSIGVAEHRPEEDIQQTIDRADQALLKAKEGGRNRVEQG